MIKKKLLRDVFKSDKLYLVWIKIYLSYLLGLVTSLIILLPFKEYKLLRIITPILGSSLISYGLIKTNELKDFETDYQIRKDARLTNLKKQLTDQPDQVEIDQSDRTSLISDFDSQSFLDSVTGIAILGNSGSAKTCLVNFLAGEVGENQFLILDPHADPENPEYPWGKFDKVISDYDQILYYLENLLTLLDRKDKQRLIIIADEYPAIRMYAKKQKSSIADDFILRYGSEARKFNKLPIFISQSGNTKALGLEGMGDFLENFALIRLQKIATKYLKTSSNIEIREAIKNIAYPMLINDDQLYLHPTHGHYSTIQKNQKPINIKSPKIIPFNIDFNFVGVATPTPPPTSQKAYTVNNVGNYQQDFNCPNCGSDNLIKWGVGRHKCKDCNKTFKSISEV